MRKIIGILLVVAMVMSSLMFAGAALAAGAVLSDPVVGECGETTVSAGDYVGSVSNMYLVVDTVNTLVQTANIPTNGSYVSLTVGPFFENTTVYYRIFGGAERDYDQPLWNHHDESTFKTQINNYGATYGWDWLIGGTEYVTPFVNWYSIDVTGCPLTKDECKNDGWMDLGFKNQGQCIKYVNEQLHADN